MVLLVMNTQPNNTNPYDLLLPTQGVLLNVQTDTTWLYTGKPIDEDESQNGVIVRTRKPEILETVLCCSYSFSTRYVRTGKASSNDTSGGSGNTEFMEHFCTNSLDSGFMDRDCLGCGLIVIAL